MFLVSCRCLKLLLFCAIVVSISLSVWVCLCVWECVYVFICMWMSECVYVWAALKVKPDWHRKAWFKIFRWMNISEGGLKKIYFRHDICIFEKQTPTLQLERWSKKIFLRMKLSFWYQVPFSAANGLVEKIVWNRTMDSKGSSKYLVGGCSTDLEHKPHYQEIINLVSRVYSARVTLGFDWK